MTLFAAFYYLVGLLTGDSLASTGAAVAVLLIAVVAAAVLAAVVLVTPGAHAAGLAMRMRAARARLPRLSDPDAEGRTRPRGPTGRPAAALS
ncbi:DUF6412 domain-containing protein [Actinoplanes sp. RD1]|uniref:DUF6412 domain-containing protein n=1 Tax=Actinoplanes sp. RD1 TaxID=3064538 RepID=UPI00274077EE|nr:DUF6412 domain-containing protein [Actinoplanes sp. RD1]